MKHRCALLLLCGVAGSAWAQPGSKTGIEIRVREWGDTDPAHWTSTASFSPADNSNPLVLEVGAFFYRNTGLGLAVAVTSIIGYPYSAADGDSAVVLDDNPTSTLHPDGRVGMFNFGGQLQSVYHTGSSGVDANRFRIAANGNAGDSIAGGISVKQNNPVALGAIFNPSDGVWGYHFKLTLARPSTANSRLFTIDALRTKIASYRVYATSTSTTATDILSSLSDTVPAVVSVLWCTPTVVIVQGPESQAMTPGVPVVFAVEAQGDNLSYKWLKNNAVMVDGGRITGSATSQLTISDPQCDDAAQYACLVSDSCGAELSDPADLAYAIHITDQPADVPLLLGHAAVFDVVAEGVDLTYRWRKNGTPLSDGGRISGATSPTLTISNLACSDAGSFDCVITDACGAVTTTVAHLLGVPVITGQTAGSIWARSGLELSVDVPAGAVYQYRWRRDGQDLFNIPGLFSGVTTRTLTIIAADPSVPGDYDCVLSYLCGTSTSQPVAVVCPADFDKNTFVNGDDVDFFREEFYWGRMTADVDENGFLNGDDFDYFMERFVAGC